MAFVVKNVPEALFLDDALRSNHPRMTLFAIDGGYSTRLRVADVHSPSCLNV
jgi:hypothetical protein